MIFIVDFEKDYDYFSWEYLLEIMKIIGFGSILCNWIVDFLRMQRASVLVRESPTNEFQIQRGLRQEDPLSPFLFILAMEGLHVAFDKAHLANVYHGITISGIDISHLFYVEDVVLLTLWDPEIANFIIRILQCFYLASARKINLYKSKLIGAGVHYSQVDVVAHRLGCVLNYLPFVHLGVPVR